MSYRSGLWYWTNLATDVNRINVKWLFDIIQQFLIILQRYLLNRFADICVFIERIGVLVFLWVLRLCKRYDSFCWLLGAVQYNRWKLVFWLKLLSLTNNERNHWFFFIPLLDYSQTLLNRLIVNLRRSVYWSPYFRCECANYGVLLHNRQLWSIFRRYAWTLIDFWVLN